MMFLPQYESRFYTEFYVKFCLHKIKSLTEKNYKKDQVSANKCRDIDRSQKP